MQKDPGKQYLTFTKKEKTGTLIVLASVLLIFVCAKYIYPAITKDKSISDKDIASATAALKEKQKDSLHDNYSAKHYDNNDGGYQSYQKKEYDHTFTGQMFYFDPNTLDATGWQKLGVKDKTIASIQKYLSKGGKFRDAEALRKIWGLREDEKERLIPYVRIAGVQQASSNYSNAYQPYEKKVYEKKTPVAVDINGGDSAAFVSLPGIGPGFSKRIINFRNKLGGFYKVDQVGETFGLPDSTFQKIKPLLKISGDNIRKININAATNDELKAHPYIRWQLANVIIEYKKQHGDFKALQDLKKIMAVNEETYNKIVPYLTL